MRGGEGNCREEDWGIERKERVTNRTMPAIGRTRQGERGRYEEEEDVEGRGQSERERETVKGMMDEDSKGGEEGEVR